MRVTGEEKVETLKKILSIWDSKEDKFLTYKEIIEAAKERGVEKRTVTRYLKKYFANLFQLEENPHRKNSSCRRPIPDAIGKIESVEKVIWTNTEIFRCQTITDLICARYAAVIDYKKTELGHVDHQRSKGFSPADIERFNLLSNNLLNDLKETLSFDYFGQSSGIDIYGVLWANVTKFVSAYIGLWSFISATYGAPDRFRDQMEALERELQKFQKKHSGEY